jgi:hypothetical protein
MKVLNQVIGVVPNGYGIQHYHQDMELRQWFTELLQGNQTNTTLVQNSSLISDAVLMSIDTKTGKQDLEVQCITPPTKHHCLPGAQGNNGIKVKSESNDHEYETY